MKPSIGRIVIYNTTDADRKSMLALNSTGSANVQKQLPAIVVCVWGDSEDAALNLKIFLDGVGDWWKTSISRGDKEGQWNWPVIAK